MHLSDSVVSERGRSVNVAIDHVVRLMSGLLLDQSRFDASQSRRGDEPGPKRMGGVLLWRLSDPDYSRLEDPANRLPGKAGVEAIRLTSRTSTCDVRE